MVGFEVAHPTTAMIHWEAPLRAVACGNCGSSDTRVSFEFLAFTRRVCPECGTAFVTIADLSGERVFTFRFHRRKRTIPSGDDLLRGSDDDSPELHGGSSTPARK
jgi:hypothetical protein